MTGWQAGVSRVVAVVDCPQGDFAWREELYDRVGGKTKAGAIDGACELTEQMLPNLECAMDYLDITEELAEILSTNLVQLEYRIETDIQINEK